MTTITSTPNLGAMSMLRGAHHPHGGRNAEQLAEQLFSKLDSNGQGFVQKADLQAVLNDGSQAAKSVTSGDLDAMFSGFDADGDGKLTRQEFTDSVKKLAAQLSQQLRLMDAQGAASSGATRGFSKDELNTKLQEVGASEGKRGALLTALVQNFDQADSNGDGKLDVNEAMQFATGANNTADAGAATATGENGKLMMQLMKLLQTYGEHGEQHKQAAALQAVTA